MNIPNPNQSLCLCASVQVVLLPQCSIHRTELAYQSLLWLHGHHRANFPGLACCGMLSGIACQRRRHPSTPHGDKSPLSDEPLTDVLVHYFFMSLREHPCDQFYKLQNHEAFRLFSNAVSLAMHVGFCKRASSYRSSTDTHIEVTSPGLGLFQSTKKESMERPAVATPTPVSKKS